MRLSNGLKYGILKPDTLRCVQQRVPESEVGPNVVAMLCKHEDAADGKDNGIEDQPLVAHVSCSKQPSDCLCRQVFLEYVLTSASF